MAKELGEQFVPVVCNVTDREAVKKAFAALPELPDVAMLNAGVGGPERKNQFDLDVYIRTFEVNYFGVLHCVDALFAKFSERKRGTFVVTSSLASYRGLPEGIAYSASKAAISNTFEGMRLTHYETGIRFVNVHPGFIDTPMTRKQNVPMPFKWPVQKAAKTILDGVEKGKLNINFPWPMWLAITLARLLSPKMYWRIMRVR